MRDHVCPAVDATGQRSRIFAATRETLEEADAAGLGELDLYAVTKLIGGRQDRSATPPGPRLR